MISEKKKLEVYIHIPFCIQKCKYCDFLSAPADELTKENYMEALCKEITEKRVYYENYEVISIFIGGGTPTTVKAEWLERVMDILKKSYHVLPNAEITLEMNPGTVDRGSLKKYMDMGINRLSIGLQSTEDDELKVLGRIHTYGQFLDTYRQAREIGFHNINVDLMSALPGQTLESYKNGLKKLRKLEPMPEHISAYSLIIEEGTLFHDMYENGILQLPDEDEERRMYMATEKILNECGYERYEISNYAKKGKACIHNLGYWKRTEYVGFGIGAASLVENVRFHNDNDLIGYISEPCDRSRNRQELTIEQQMEETMFLGLRMTRGVSAKEFKTQYGLEMTKVYGEAIQKHEKAGLLEWVYEDDNYIRLTARGMDVANYVMTDFLEPDLFS